MANKNSHVVLAYFPGADKADAAANQLKAWDQANDAIKLGGIGILTWQEGKMHTRKVGGRQTGSGAKWGTAIGATAGILSGGVTLIGGALVGAASGAVTGALFHKRLGLTDADKARMEEHLRKGGAVLVAMADDNEVEATTKELVGLGGKVEDYKVPEEAMEKIETATNVEAATVSEQPMANAGEQKA
jgi:uncharacterized membrane protein